MGVKAALQARLGRWALRRPHLLLATAPAATAARLAVEAYAARLDAVLALTPADADVLVVIGDPGQELGEAFERMWRQLPGPRARIRVTDPAVVESALREACGRLADPQQVADAAARHDEWATGQHNMGGRQDHDDHGGHEGHAGHEGHVGGSGGHNGGQGDRGEQEHDSGHEQHGSHAAHDGDGQHSDDAGQGGHDGQGGHGGGGHGGHGGHGMEMPGGLMMAERAADRDGLKLDVLHVPLGPVLPSWPAGLVVDTVLQGDVVQHAEARVLAPAAHPPVPFWVGGDGKARRRRHAAAYLDSLGRLLGVAGWERAVAEAWQVRDEVLAGAPLERVHGRFSVFERRLLRSRTLRWATDGLGVLDLAEAARIGVSGPALRAVSAGGDVTARWRRWLVEAGRLLAGEEPVAGEGPRGELDGARAPSWAVLEAATRLMVGLDVAAARLVLASFDPDPDELVAATPAGDAR